MLLFLPWSRRIETDKNWAIFHPRKGSLCQKLGQNANFYSYSQNRFVGVIGFFWLHGLPKNPEERLWKANLKYALFGYEPFPVKKVDGERFWRSWLQKIIKRKKTPRSNRGEDHTIQAKWNAVTSDTVSTSCGVRVEDDTQAQLGGLFAKYQLESLQPAMSPQPDKMITRPRLTRWDLDRGGKTDIWMRGAFADKELLKFWGSSANTKRNTPKPHMHCWYPAEINGFPPSGRDTVSRLGVQKPKPIEIFPRKPKFRAACAADRSRSIDGVWPSIKTLTRKKEKKATPHLIATFRFSTNKSALFGATGLSKGLKDMSQGIAHPQFFYVYGILIVGGFPIRAAFSQDFKHNTNICMQQTELLLLVR